MPFKMGHKINLGVHRKHTKETRDKLAIITANRVFSDDMKRSISNKIRLSKIGNKNYNWRGGTSNTDRHKIMQSYKYKSWRQNIFIRDNFTCTKCGKRNSNISAHHIKSFLYLLNKAKEYLPLMDSYDAAINYAPMWDDNNGITLCDICHKIEHRVRVKEVSNGTIPKQVGERR